MKGLLGVLNPRVVSYNHEITRILARQALISWERSRTSTIRGEKTRREAQANVEVTTSKQLQAFQPQSIICDCLPSEKGSRLHGKETDMKYVKDTISIIFKHAIRVRATSHLWVYRLAKRQA